MGYDRNPGTRAAEVEDFSEGLYFSDSNISPLFALDRVTLNVSMGRYVGLQPRYGIAPVKNQFHNELSTAQTYAILPALAPKPCSLQYSEANGTRPLLRTRRKLYGCFPTRFRQYPWREQSEATVYVWPVTGTATLGLFQFAHGAFVVEAATYNGVRLEAGIDTPVSGEDTGSDIADRFTYFRVRDTSLTRFKLPTTPGNQYAVAAFNVSGKNIPATNQRLLALAPPSLASPTLNNPGPLTYAAAGHTQEHNYADFASAAAAIEVQLLGTAGTGTYATYQRYFYDAFKFLTTNTQAVLFHNDGREHLTPGVCTSQIPGISAAATDVAFPVFALVKSPQSVIRSAYQAFFLAGPNPIGAILQDWVLERSVLDSSSKCYSAMQYFDPCELLHAPSTRATLNEAATGYQEDSSVRRTSWNTWPNFTSGTPLATDAASATNGIIHVTLGAANTGLLRKNTVYEISFSIYDKSTDTETNVGEPARIQTGADDFVRLTVYRRNSAAPSQRIARTDANCPFLPTNDIARLLENPNWYEIRFYYRAFGAVDWLPTVRVDLAAAFFDGTLSKLWICEGPVAGLPGGAPGAFNDYSPLPRDTYVDVRAFQGFVFWMSSKSLIYSNFQSAFTYPVKNAVPAQVGSYVGMIEHAYPGQSDQDSRLVVFTTTGVYEGRFRGDGYLIEEPVRVSPDSIATFPRIGSDFRLSFWTDLPAFSSRSACVADGILFWWGPRGIARDDGVSLPTKQWMEYMDPDINEIYDPTKTGRICSVYNSRTKEVIWFFEPSAAYAQTCTTLALVLNTRKESFYLFGFKDLYVDWAQPIDSKLSSDAFNQDGSGLRIMLGVRSTADTVTQRSVFFDELVDAGDCDPPHQLQVTQVASIAGGHRLTIASGSTIPAGLTGTKLTIDKFKFYANRSEECDGVYTITGQTATTIDIATNASATPLPAVTLAQPHYFAVWVENVTGFPFRLKSQFWAPFGMKWWGRFIHFHHRYRVALKAGQSPVTISLKFQSLIGTDEAVQTTQMSDNCRGSFQVRGQVPQTKQNQEGQAIAIEIGTPGGTWNGGRWTLQYLSYDAIDMDKDNLTHWEG